MPKPTIAAIGGPAAGAGLSLALACDLRYAVAGAVLTTAFAKVAFVGDYGGTWFLTRLVGSSKAKELYYFSERLSAEDAQRLGIVNAVFPRLTSSGRSWNVPAGWRKGRRSLTAT
jgi:2-(1,2-epoxy-1,2-dihydrophenyl)acetyl-CoA isomerase